MVLPVELQRNAERYELADRIGAGGMGEVYLARDRLLNRRVVIKRLRTDFEEAERHARMFLDEARTIAQLDHPNIVKIFDIGVRDAAPFMALEWLEGWDLRTLSRLHEDAPLPLNVVLQLIMDACDGLHAAHVAEVDGRPLRIVHRDVSPHNLFVTTAGVLKVLDFGVAKTAFQETTGVRSIKGKVAYMAPEQIEGRPIDGRADVFALGLVLHELLAGKHVFAGLSPNEMVQAIRKAPVPPPARPDDPIPEAVVALTTRAVQRDPELRFQSAAELRDGLSAVLDPEFTRAALIDYLQTLTRDGNGTPAPEGPTSGRHFSLTSVPIGSIASNGELADSDLQTINAAIRRFTARITEELPPPAAKKRSYGRTLLLAAGLGSAALVATVLATSLLTAPAHTADPEPAEPPPTRSAPAAAPAPVPRPAPEPAGERAVAPTAAARPTPRRVPKGALTLDSVPWANVFIDGKRVGPTPLINHPVRAGPVKVRLVNKEFGVDHTETIRIKANAETRRRIVLPQ